MVADTSGWGSRFFPEIRIRFRSSNSVVMSPRLQAALLSCVLLGTAALAVLGVREFKYEHLVAKKEAAAARAQNAKGDLEKAVGSLRQKLAALRQVRDEAEDRAATFAHQAGVLRGRLSSTEAKAQSLDQTRQALQQEKAQSAALSAQLGKIEADRAAEEAQFAQYKTSLEETAKQLDELGAARGKPAMRYRVRLQLGAIWRRLSQIELPPPGNEVAAAAPNPSAAPAAAAASTPAGQGVAGEFGRAEADAFERAAASAGVDVGRILSKIGPAPAEGGPFVPPPKDGLAADTVSPEKLAAIEALAKTLPVSAPLAEYQIGSPFGARIDPFNGRPSFHTGIDMDAPYSSPVYAASAGTVIYAGWLGDYGKVVEIDHGFGIVTLYAHLHRWLVSVGQNVAAQTEIGLVGTTGRSTGAHVHYEVRVDGQPQDPEKFLGLARLLPAAARQLSPAAAQPAENSR